MQASLVAQLVQNAPAMQTTLVQFLGQEDPLDACNTGDAGSLPESGRSPGEGHGHPLQYSCLENPMDRGVWQAAVHGVAKSWTQLK